MSEELEVSSDEQSEQPLSLRDTLNNAVKEVAEKQAAKEVEEKVEKPSKDRSEDGKFAKKQEKEEVASKDDFPKEQTEKVEEKTTNAAPQSWNAAAKAEWDKVPPSLQAEINRREGEMHKSMTRLDEERTFGKQMKETISPYMPIIDSLGIPPMKAIQSLLNVEYQLRTASPEQKVQLMHTMAKNYGVNLGNAPAQAYVDPQVQALQQRVESQEQRWAREEQFRAQQQNNEVQGVISAFASDPANIHFETVKQHMGVLLERGLAKDMKDAYDQAVYANPSIRSTLLEQQTAAALEAKREAIKNQTNAAKRASVSLTGSPGGAIPNGKLPERSLREELAAQFSAYMQ